MQLKTRSRYSIKALLELSLQSDRRPLSVRTIADRQDIPAPYLEKLLIALRHAKIVESVRGVHGGYRLARSPASIFLGQVLEAVGESLELPAMRHDQPERAEDWAIACLHRRLRRKLDEALYTVSLEELYYDLRSWQAAQGDLGNFLV
jgi:Rrf2 family transcriptional regulator, iron-sulfur cluster assembly transcription factor